MRRRLVQWLAPPSRSSPAETLRWVRRMSLFGGAFALVIAGQFALEGESGVLIAVLVAGGLLSASTWVTLTPVIRRADERGALTTAELSSARRRENRAFRFMSAFYCIAFPVAGYIVEGVAGAVPGFVLGAVASLGVSIGRRLRDRTD